MLRWFKYDGKLPSLNEVVGKNRANKYAGATQKKNVQNSLYWTIKKYQSENKITPIDRQCVVLITFYESNRRRDIDNVQSSTKFVLDALQQAGILPNDNPKWVKDIKHKVMYADKDAVLVELFEDCEFEVSLKKLS